MAQMGITNGTDNFGTHHAQRDIDLFPYIFRVDRCKKTWSATTGVEFRIGNEQGRSTIDARINTGLVMVPVLAGKGRFRRGLSGHGIRHRGKLRSPFGIRLLNSGFAHNRSLQDIELFQWK